MPKRSYTLIAEHFGTDAESIRDYEYQHGHFSRRGVLTAWTRVISNYDGQICVVVLQGAGQRLKGIRMIPHSPKPLQLTIDDQVETRIYQTKQSMRFPVDEETTEKLRQVIRLDASAPLPWTRRLLRCLRRMR